MNLPPDETVPPEGRTARTDAPVVDASALTEAMQGWGLGCVVVDADGRVRQGNAQAASWLALGGQAWVGVSLTSLFSGWTRWPDPLQPARAPLLLDGLRPQACPQVGPLQASLLPLTDGGRPAGWCVLFRQAEPAPPSAQRALSGEQLQERFRLVFEAAPNGLLLVDAQGHIALANRRAEHLFEYAPGRLAGISVAALLPAGAREGHAPLMARVFAEREARPMGAGRDIQALKSDGTTIPVEIGLSPIDLPEGPHVLASVIDITDRQRRDDELRRSNADLEQFAYVASHDLQEPLRMVSSYTSLLAQRYKGQLDERADKYIFYAVDGAQRMQRLVADLLAYSRVGSEGKPMHEVDAEEVLAQVVHTLGPRLRETGGRVTAGPLPRVMADGGQLYQLFQNLVGNALKFHADAPPEVMVSATCTEGSCTFAVKDNGIGLDPRYADRIFQMFQRLHERGRYGGSGIGLAIAKRILERHGGRIWVDSAPGCGSTFYFTLRAAPSSGLRP